MQLLRFSKENRLGKLLRLYRFLFGQYTWGMLNLVVLTLISSMLESINLLVLYPLINYGLELKSNSFVLDLFDRLASLLVPDNLFLFYCYLLIIISIVTVGFKAFTQFVSYRMLKKISAFFLNAVFVKFSTIDYGFFVKNQQGKLIHTGTTACTATSAMILEFIRTITAFLSFIVLFLTVCLVSWKGSVLIMIVGVIYVFIVKRVSSKIIYHYGILNVAEDRQRNVILNEFLTGIKAIRVFLVSSAWVKKYYNTVDRMTGYEFKVLMGRVIPESMIKLSFFVIVAGSGIFIERYTNGNFLPLLPVFGTFALLATRLLPAAQLLGICVMGLVSSLPNTKIIYDLMNKNPEEIKEGKRFLDGFSREIVFDNIWFSFSETIKPLFNGISFTIKKGETTAIVGASGSGKSTIINLLFRLFPLEKGKILIDGVDISNYTFESYLGKISYVSQETFIYNSSIKENIRFGMENCTDEMIIEAAKLANAHDFIMESQERYDTIIGDAGIKISGGQRQRIAIARAMLRKPAILVLDEATSSLDSVSESKVQSAINNLSKHTSVLIVAHRLSTIMESDKIIVLSDGKIVEEGIHDDLLNLEGEYSRLYALQSNNTLITKN